MAADDYSINTGIVKRFGTVDYVLFSLTLVISAGIGVVFAILDRKRNTTKEFLLGGRRMNVFPVAFSLMVTFMSALTLLGNPAEIYNYHTMFWYLCVAFLIAMFFAAHIFIPFFYNLGITSTFEYLQMRFGLLIRILGCFVLILQTLLYMAFLLYAPSLALNAVTGLHLWGSVVGMGIVVTFYTTLGGMKAVLWTDTFQAGVIFAGLLAVLIKGSMVMGGFANAWELADERHRILFDDFSFDPKTRHSVWSMIIGGWAFWMYLYGINQAQVQRCLSCPTVRKAQLAVAINLPGLILIVSLCCMIGVVMFAFYRDCHPISFKLIDKTDQLMPLFVMDILGDYPGVPGIFVSCVISGSLSSLSSGLNALAAVTFKDILQQTCMKKPISEFRSTILSKGLVIGYGLLAIALAWIVSNLGSVLQAVYVVFGILNGPLLGVFTLGMFFPWANKHGALGGLLVSLTFLFWIGIAAFVNELKTPLSSTTTAMCNFTAKPLPSTTPKPPPKEVDDPFEDLYRMSYMYYTALGMIITWGIGLPISFITGYTRPKSLDPRLICPLAEKLVPCLPKKVKNFFRCGIVHEGKYEEDVDIDLSLKDTKDPAKSYPEKNGAPPSEVSGKPTNGYSKPRLDADEENRYGKENPGFEKGENALVTQI